jgi:hypothetical protein
VVKEISFNPLVGQLASGRRSQKHFKLEKSVKRCFVPKSKKPFKGCNRTRESKKDVQRGAKQSEQITNDLTAIFGIPWNRELKAK